MTSSHIPYKVFISHAGEDKTTIAFPLRERLCQHRISAFVDEKDMPGGTWSEEAMITAMETAEIAVVVLGPEFVARKWPMKELFCFLRRAEEPPADGRRLPVIIPLFYRLSIQELYTEPKLERRDQNGKILYQASRFFDRMENGEPEADIDNIQAALRKLHGVMGVENYVSATNECTSGMLKCRNVLVNDLLQLVLNAVKRISDEINPIPRDVATKEPDSCPHHHDGRDVSDQVLNTRGSVDDINTPSVEAAALHAALDTPALVKASTPHVSYYHTSSSETTTAYSLVSDLARGCKDLVVYSSRALIALRDEVVLRVQEALVASAMADCSECLRLLGNKTWFFCGSNRLPTFVAKMALIGHPNAARHKIVDILMSFSWFGRPEVTLDVQSKNHWVASTTMDVSFVNALIFKRHFALRSGPRAEGFAGVANEINSELSIPASDMLLVLQALRWQSFSDQGLVIVSHGPNGEQGLGWYRVQFLDVSGLKLLNVNPAFRLEYICSLEDARGGGNSPADMKDMMILNFLHVTEISPEARELREYNGRKSSYMTTALENEPNMWEGYQATFDEINVEGVAYTELLEIACLHTLRAGFYARCQSFVDSLVDIVDERQLVVSTDARCTYLPLRDVPFAVSTSRGHRHMHLRQGREIAFDLLAEEFATSVEEDAKERNKLASCLELYEYGRFCAQGEVTDSWYDLLVPRVNNRMDVNFAQVALTGRGSYAKFLARNMSVCLKDSILLSDPASDSVAVAFDGVSEMSSSLKVGISELIETTESQKLRAAFFICRGAVRARRDTSTRMLDVIRSRYMGLKGIESISVQDVVADLDEGEQRNPAVFVECMESLALQGGYEQDGCETSLFTALCSIRQCEKTMLVTGIWPPLFGMFSIRWDGKFHLVTLDESHKKWVIFALKHGDVYRAQQICQFPDKKVDFITSNEFVCVQ